jgi:hypothetical protein
MFFEKLHVVEDDRSLKKGGNIFLSIKIIPQLIKLEEK